MKKIAWLVILYLCSLTTVFAANAEYNSATGLLKIPVVTVDQQKYYDVEVVLQGNGQYQITKANQQASSQSPSSAESQFNLQTRLLTISSVVVGEKTYINVSLKLGVNGFYQITAAQEQTTTTQIAQSCDGVSMNDSKYNAITTGMSIAQVNQIIGCQGAVQSSSTFAGVLIESYQWFNTSGIEAIGATFEDGKLWDKTKV